MYIYEAMFEHVVKSGLRRCATQQSSNAWCECLNRYHPSALVTENPVGDAVKVGN